MCSGHGQSSELSCSSFCSDLLSTVCVCILYIFCYGQAYRINCVMCKGHTRNIHWYSSHLSYLFQYLKQLQATEPVAYFHFMHYCICCILSVLAGKWLSTSGLRENGTFKKQQSPTSVYQCNPIVSFLVA